MRIQQEDDVDGSWLVRIGSVTPAQFALLTPAVISAPTLNPSDSKKPRALA